MALFSFMLTKVSSMKPVKLLFFALFLSFSAHAQVNLGTVGEALRTGNAKLLSDNFDKQIELSLKTGEESIRNSYSKEQARSILEDFFKKNQPNKFEQRFDGKANEWLKYTIGYLHTSNGKYRSLIRFRETEDGILIQEIEFTRISDNE